MCCAVENDIPLISPWPSGFLILWEMYFSWGWPLRSFLRAWQICWSSPFQVLELVLGVGSLSIRPHLLFFRWFGWREMLGPSRMDTKPWDHYRIQSSFFPSHGPHLLQCFRRFRWVRFVWIGDLLVLLARGSWRFMQSGTLLWQVTSS